MIHGVNFYFMNDIEKIHDWIDRFNDNELNDAELEEFRELLENDPVLRAEVRLDKELNEMLQDEGLMSLQEKISVARSNYRDKRSTGYRRLLLAASIVGIVALSVALYLIVGIKTSNNKVNQNTPFQALQPGKKNSTGQDAGNVIVEKRLASKDSLSVSGKEISGRQNQMLAQAEYKPYPPFESLIGTHLRSGDFRFVNPAQGSHFNGESSIVFSWTTENPHALSLKIMDNHGRLIFDSHPIRGKSYTIKERTLGKGLFYFKIMEEDEIVYFGKLMIETN
jgi:hypothetical protein